MTLLEGELRQEMFGFAGLPSVFSRAWLALCGAEIGRFDEAAMHAEQAVAIAEAANHAFSLVVAYAGAGTVYGQRGGYTKAIGCLERAFASSHESDTPISFPLIAAPLGWVLSCQGRFFPGQLIIFIVSRADEKLLLGLAVRYGLSCPAGRPFSNGQKAAVNGR